MAILLASIIGLAVEQRHRELALLRTIGATPKQVRRLVVARDHAARAGRGRGGRARRPGARPRAVRRASRTAASCPTCSRSRQGVLPLVAGALARAADRPRQRRPRRPQGRPRPARRGARRGRGAAGRARPRPARAGRACCAAGAVSCGAVTLFMSPENAAATGGGTALAGALACALVAPRLTERLAGRASRPPRRFPASWPSPTSAPARTAPPRWSAGDPRRLDRAGQHLPADHAGQRASTRPRAGRRQGRRRRSTDQHGLDRAPGRPLAPDRPVAAARRRPRRRGTAERLAHASGTPSRSRGLDSASATRSAWCSATAPTSGCAWSRSSPARAATARSSCRDAAARPHLRPPGPDPPEVDVWITFAVVAVILAYAALSLVNSLVAALRGRRRELDAAAARGRDDAPGPAHARGRGAADRRRSARSPAPRSRSPG